MQEHLNQKYELTNVSVWLRVRVNVCYCVQTIDLLFLVDFPCLNTATYYFRDIASDPVIDEWQLKRVSLTFWIITRMSIVIEFFRFGGCIALCYCSYILTIINFSFRIYNHVFLLTICPVSIEIKIFRLLFSYKLYIS